MESRTCPDYRDDADFYDFADFISVHLPNPCHQRSISRFSCLASISLKMLLQ